MSVKFTAVFIKNLKYKGHQEDLTDSVPLGVAGQLCIRVGKHKISWFIQYRSNGKRRKLNIATYPTVGLADARKSAVEKLLEISNGHDPQQAKKIRKTAPTVSDLWQAYQDSLDLKKKKKAPASLDNEVRVWNKEIKPFIGKLKVEDITPMILSDILDAKAKKAPVAANRLHSLLSIMWKPALKKGWSSVHPLQWIEKPGGSEPPRKVVLSNDDIQTLWPHFNNLKSNPRDMMKLGLYTAQRPGEIARMRWEDIDFNDNTWTGVLLNERTCTHPLLRVYV